MHQNLKFLVNFFNCYWKKMIKEKKLKKLKKRLDIIKNKWYIRNICSKKRAAKENDLWKLSKTSIWVAKETNELK